MQTEYTYEPFGSAATSGALTTSAFAFTGREADGTGLNYYRARYYHPVTQRFTAEDPISFCGGDVNLFAYVGNSPLIATDPTGLCPACPIAIPVAGAVARAAAAALAALTQMANAEVGNRLNDRRRSQKECYRRLQEDWERCKKVSDPEDAAECWKQAMERYSACRRGADIPPLFPWEPWK